MQKSQPNKLGRSIEDILKDNQINPVDLFDEKTEPQYLMIGLDKININDLHLSRRISNEDINKLVSSIHEYGIITPIVVRKSDTNHYDLITGIKRLKAATQLNIKSIPAIALSIDPSRAFDLMVHEILSNGNLNPIEKASTYQFMHNELKLNHQEIARRFNCSRPSITNHLRLLKLDRSIQNDLIEGRLSFGQARPLVQLDPDNAKKIANEIIAKNLSAREVEHLVNSLINNQKDNLYLSYIENISQNYDCSVKISKNRISIKCNDNYNFKRILTRLARGE